MDGQRITFVALWKMNDLEFFAIFKDGMQQEIKLNLLISKIVTQGVLLTF